MAKNDWYTEQAQAQWQQLSAQKAQVLARIEDCKANGYGAAEEVQELANIKAQRGNLVRLHEQYKASQEPPAPVELTQEQKAALPWDQMGPRDVWDMAATSKYGVDEAGFRAGLQEVARRRARGE